MPVRQLGQERIIALVFPMLREGGRWMVRSAQGNELVRLGLRGESLALSSVSSLQVDLVMDASLAPRRHEDALVRKLLQVARSG